MLSILSSRSNRDNLSVENFGRAWNDSIFYPRGKDFAGGVDGSDNTAAFGGIGPGGYQTVSFKPLCGLLNQPLYIPLCFPSTGLTMEFELVASAADAVVAPNTLAAIAASTTFFNPTNTSTAWTISYFHIIGDIITLDSALQNS